ncbi:hypothetical protein [Streptomyces paludis]|uniref:hypothetical protein n=1 Tax=Streptomyces paludis TaxID=2282738 RepID=UPI0015F2D7C6|nr:hypothetical protein [Streptomyces paludis]
MSPRRTAAALTPALSGALACVLSGVLAACAGQSGLKSAGPTPTAIGPVRLWPGLPPISAPPLDFGESTRDRVPGIKVPHNDLTSLSPVTVVRAEAAAHPNDLTGVDGLPERTAARLAACGAGTTTSAGGGGNGGRGPGAAPAAPAGCPVLTAYHHDLTGDGRADLIIGIELPYQQLAVRCYTAENGGLTRIMSTADQVVGAELAGRDLILRVVSAGIPGYEYRTAWSWDGRRGTMLPTRDEIVPADRSPAPTPDGTVTELPVRPRETDGPGERSGSAKLTGLTELPGLAWPMRHIGHDALPPPERR